jgi:hypothetical protein
MHEDVSRNGPKAISPFSNRKEPKIKSAEFSEKLLTYVLRINSGIILLCFIFSRRNEQIHISR